MGIEIGTRMIKTGIAVFITLLVTQYIVVEIRVLSVIASVIAMQPSVIKSWSYLKDVLIGNILAVFFAVTGFYFLGNSPIVIGLIVILSISLNIKLGITKNLNLVVLSVVSIMLSNGENFGLLYVAGRVSSLLLGILVAFIVNAFIFPPKHEESLEKMLGKLDQEILTILGVLKNNDFHFKQREDAVEKISADLFKIKEYYNLLYEERKYIFKRNKTLYLKKIVVFKHRIKMCEYEISLIKNSVRFNKEEYNDKYINEYMGLVYRQKNNLSLYKDNKLKLNKNKLLCDPNNVLVVEKRIINQIKCIEEENISDVLPILSNIIKVLNKQVDVSKKIKKVKQEKKEKKRKNRYKLGK